MAEEEKKEEQEEESGQTFWNHLEALRWSIMHMAIAVVICAIGTFCIMPYLFDHVILAPTKGTFFVYQFINRISQGIVGFAEDFNVEIININVTSQFMTHISTAISFGLVIAFPFIIWEIWKFIRPALYDNEVKNMRSAFLGGTLMFYLGCLVGYIVVFPLTFRFLVEYQLSPEIKNQINLSSYIGIFTMMIFVMGLVFEMPLVAWLLSALGILHKSFLKKYRRHAIVALMIIAAIITPSGDPFTLMVVFIPLYCLYELSIRVVRK